MSSAYPYVFLGLLIVYMIYSQFARLDSRLPIAAGLVLLVFAGILDAAGAPDAANNVAVYVYFLIGAGVVLLLIDYVRDARRSASGEPDPLPPSQAPEGGVPDGALGPPAR